MGADADVRSPVRAALSPGAVLFLAMFASQASILVLSPILPAVAEDLQVSTATAAQLRSLSGVVAGSFALWLGVRSRPHPLRQLLLVGLALLGGGSLASSVSPTFAVLAAAQVAIGLGLAVVLSGALAASAEWSPDTHARTLSWALAGQPAAWIVGMPVAGAVAGLGWRYAWLAVPFATCVLALVAVATRPSEAAPPPAANEPALWGQRGTKGWAAGELLAYGGWAGTLVFVGALFIESYGLSTAAVGLLLAAGACAYLPGTFLARRWLEGYTRGLLVLGAVLSGLGVAAFGVLRSSLGLSILLFSALAFVAGARTIAGSSHGLSLAPACRLQAMSFRTAAVQYGYLLGAAVGGAALTLWGYPGLGVALGVLYGLAALPHVLAVLPSRSQLRGGQEDSTQT